MHPARFFQSLRIIRSDDRSFRQELLPYRQRRRFPKIVGVGLERETQHSKSFPFQPTDRLANLHNHLLPLGLVYPRSGRGDLHRIAVALPRLDKGSQIFGETGSAESGSGMEKLGADSMVEPHALG